MERCKIITHQGKMMVYMDFTKLSAIPEIEAIVSEGIKLIRSKPPASVLTLCDFTDMNFNNEITKLFESFTTGNKHLLKRAL